jgi:hypothetical protein
MYHLYYYSSRNASLFIHRGLPWCLESTKHATNANVYWFQLTGPIFC